jgi:hypothetical protein
MMTPMARPLARLRLAFVAVAAALSVGLAACGTGSNDRFVGHAPPSIDTATGAWLNADAPLTWKGLIGNVVYLQFGFLR